LEDAPISMYCKNFGFITLEGKIVQGVYGDELHSTVARRLGFKGQLPEQKAIRAGLVRFAVDDDNGNATFQFIPSAKANSYIVKFIRKAKEIFGTVYFDIADKGGHVIQSKEMPVDKATRFVLSLA